MKKVKQTGEKNFFKKTFIKLCRIIGYEIIDQNNFESPTLDKKLTDNLSILGNKSISIPLGEVKITRRVKSLTIYMRTCAKVYLWKQNKERIFGKEKTDTVFAWKGRYGSSPGVQGIYSCWFSQKRKDWRARILLLW